MTVKEIKLLYSDEWRKGNWIDDPIRVIHRFYTNDWELVIQLPCDKKYLEEDLIIAEDLRHVLQDISSI